MHCNRGLIVQCTEHTHVNAANNNQSSIVVVLFMSVVQIYEYLSQLITTMMLTKIGSHSAINIDDGQLLITFSGYFQVLVKDDHLAVKLSITQILIPETAVLVS